MIGPEHPARNIVRAAFLSDKNDLSEPLSLFEIRESTVFFPKKIRILDKSLDIGHWYDI